MTFSEALTIWRNEIVVDIGTSRWDNPEGYRILGNAAAEVAAKLGFPKATSSSVALAVGAYEFAAPADMLDIELNSLNIGGVAVAPAPWSLVARKRFMPASPYPRYYSYDPEHAGTVQFAPPISRAVAAGGVTFRYVQEVGRDVDGTDEIWGGIFPQWHHIVPLRAGENTYREVELYERANEFAQVYSRELQAFSAFLGKTNMANATIPPEARNDAGSVTG